MLTILKCTISPSDKMDLDSRQAEINAQATFEESVNLAKLRFDQKPKPLFTRIRAALQSVSGDLVRCGYCEDSCADEVEHVWPKNFFPNRTFDYTNYLFSCGICNPAKSDKFSVRHNELWIDLPSQRKVSGFVVPPSANARFIDPLTESPLDFLWLDIVGGTLMFVPIHDEGTLEYDRADFTINTLRLNRKVLVEARKNAYQGFRDRIFRYVECKLSNEDQAELDRRLFDLRRAPHQTVRMEMSRQLGLIDKLHQQIDSALEVFQ